MSSLADALAILTPTPPPRRIFSYAVSGTRAAPNQSNVVLAGSHRHFDAEGRTNPACFKRVHEEANDGKHPIPMPSSFKIV